MSQHYLRGLEIERKIDRWHYFHGQEALAPMTAQPPSTSNRRPPPSPGQSKVRERGPQNPRHRRARSRAPQVPRHLRRARAGSAAWFSASLIDLSTTGIQVVWPANYPVRDRVSIRLPGSEVSVAADPLARR